MASESPRDARNDSPNGTIEWHDDSCPGLLIKIGRKSATWYLRGRCAKKQCFIKLKDLAADDQPDNMRKLATETKLKLTKFGDVEKVKNWLTVEVLGGEIERHGDPALDGWTWQHARDEYLAHIKIARREATHDDYNKTLKGQDFGQNGMKWDNRLVKSLSDDDVIRLLNHIHKRAPGRMADHTLRVLRPCLTWVAKHPDSGTKVNPALGAKAPELIVEEDPDSDEADDGWVPTEEDVGKLPWLLNATPRVHPAMRLAAMIALLTAQRRRTVITARHKDFEPLEDGGALWIIPPAYMKSGRKRTKRQKSGKVVALSPRPHVVPLPPLTWHIVRQAMAMASSSETWIFPQLRLYRKGDIGGKHMGLKAIGDAMEAAGSPVRPHACRRAFATHGESKAGIIASETPAILDHAEGRTGDTTKESYALHDGSHFKWPIMRKWEGWVVDQIRQQDPSGKHGLPAFLVWS
jgi:integrase